MANLEEMTKLWELAYLQESAQLCVLHNYYIQIYYIQIYINLFSNFPIEGPSITNLYVAFTICIQDQTCN